MAYAPNGDLLEYINKRGFVFEDQARKIFKQIVAAICHSHACGIVHRDLKCENILLDANMDVKVTDFGFASILKTAGELLTTNCGSHAYAAPEIWRNRSVHSLCSCASNVANS